jgi:hypothetical protein
MIRITAARCRRINKNSMAGRGIATRSVKLPLLIFAAQPISVPIEKNVESQIFSKKRLIFPLQGT